MFKYEILINKIESEFEENAYDFLYRKHVVEGVKFSDIQKELSEAFGERVRWSHLNTVFEKLEVPRQKERSPEPSKDFKNKVETVERVYNKPIREVIETLHNVDKVSIDAIPEVIMKNLERNSIKLELHRSFVNAIINKYGIKTWKVSDKKKNRIKRIEKFYGKTLKEIIIELHLEQKLNLNRVAKKISEDTGENVDEGFVRYHSKKLGIIIWKSDKSELLTRRNNENWKDSAYRQMMSDSSKKLWKDPEHQKKIREFNIEMWKDPEHRKKVQAKLIELWKTDEYSKKMYGAYRNRKTKIEIWTEEFLNELNVTFTTQEPLLIDDSLVIPDIKIGNKIIEVNGDYWHANPVKYNPNNLTDIQRDNVERDLRKAELYKKSGYELLIIWEHDIKKSPNIVKNKISEFLQS